MLQVLFARGGGLMTDTDANPDISLDLPEGWTFELQLTRSEDQTHGGVAELREGGVLRCRMLLSNVDRDRKVALDRVATRVERWLADWQARDHSGSTGFIDL
jgi:hypothetical protein